MNNSSTFEIVPHVPSNTDKQQAFDQLLYEHLGAKAQIAGDVTLHEAKASGLYRVLRAEILDFLDFFHGLHTWKRLYVSSKFNLLRDEMEAHSGTKRRVMVIQIASEMHDLLKATFRDDDDGYRKATDGLARIVEIFLTWASGLNTSDIPKYGGIKVHGNPVAFLQKHYALWIADGRLSQISLRERDEKLLNALKYELRKKERSLSELVPPGIRR